MSKVGNIDEVGLSFDIPRNYTESEKRAKYVRITTNGVEKCNFIVVLCITADRAKCISMVIFKRKTIPKGNFPKNTIVKANPNTLIQEILDIY